MTCGDNTSFKTTVVIHPRSCDSLIISRAAADRLRPVRLSRAEDVQIPHCSHQRNKAPVSGAQREKNLHFIHIYTLYEFQCLVLLTVHAAGVSGGAHRNVGSFID